MVGELDFTVPNLGERKIPSPILMSKVEGDSIANYVDDDERIIFELEGKAGERRRVYRKEELVEVAGPRETIFFNPGHVHAGIVTCGGICPGLNDVIRAIVRCLWIRYGVRRISGIQMGYKGLL
ncbi:MAG TPA: 6-phosphofructokinase, partial [Spirochaetia bacterium]|nr:6-phosphofructokinase [Spirochaetia bacterium]